MLLAVERVGLHGPLALYEGYPNIEQACDDSKAAVQTIVLFTRSAARTHARSASGHAQPRAFTAPCPSDFSLHFSCLHSAD